MTDLLPPAAAGIRTGLPASALTVDPAALAEAPARLLQRAAALRSGAPALLAAWQQAAEALAAEHTGGALCATRPGSGAALAECAVSVEALAESLRRSAFSYASTEAAAVPQAPDRGRAWIP